MLIGAAALGRGYAVHRDAGPLALGVAGLALMGTGLVLPDGGAEIGCTMAGVLLLALALAHRRNAGHAHRSRGLAVAPPNA